MNDFVTTSYLDQLIKTEIKNVGVVLDKQTIDSIKVKIKDLVNADSGYRKPEQITNENNPLINQQINQPVANDSNNQILNVNPLPATPEEINKSYTNIEANQEVSEEKIELAKKEGEISEKERMLLQKEQELSEKEKILAQKEAELTYKPTLPVSLESNPAVELVVFNRDELSFGGDSLKDRQFRTKADPDTKQSMRDVWMKDGTSCADIFIIKMEKIGQIKFDPFNGTATFSENRDFKTEPSNNTNLDDVSNVIEKAKASQLPTEPMIDAIAPLTDVSIPSYDEMLLSQAPMSTIEKMIHDKLESILKKYFPPQIS